MLTARNVLILTIVVAVVSLVWAGFEVSRPPDGGGLGHDSYGTRARGGRGLFEVLADLGIPVERVTGPPTAVVGREATLVLWDPQPDLVQVEPAYLHAVARWVEGGGRVVVATDGRRPVPRETGFSKREKPARVLTVLGELGLPGATVVTVNLVTGRDVPVPQSDDRSSAGRTPRSSPDAGESDGDDLRRLRDILTGATRPVATRAVAVAAAGAMSPLVGVVSEVELPEEKAQVLNVGDSAPDGTLTFRDEAGGERVLAAHYRRGKGEMIVVACPAIAENSLIARQDNSVLMVRLLAAAGRPVVFDEFYHGLTIRGNPLWLFAQRGYAATTLCLLVAIGLWMWREAIFLGPPLDPRPASRRSLGEYVDAMARFLNRGGSSHRFLLREIRSGVLKAVRDELHLPPSRDHVEELAAVLARRDPGRARELVEAIGAVDAALARKRGLKESVVVDLFKRMTRCL